MVQFVNDANPAGTYETVAASQTNQAIGPVGATGDYLDSITIVAATTTPGAVTLKDGSTTVLSIPAGTATVLPYTLTIFIRAYSVSGSWNITTGASVSVLAVGKFT